MTLEQLSYQLASAAGIPYDEAHQVLTGTGIALPEGTES